MKFNNKTLQQIFLLRMQGYSSVDIAKQVDIHPVTINDKLREFKSMDSVEFEDLVRDVLTRFILNK